MVVLDSLVCPEQFLRFFFTFFQHLLHILTLSISDCIILRAILSFY